MRGELEALGTILVEKGVVRSGPKYAVRMEQHSAMREETKSAIRDGPALIE